MPIVDVTVTNGNVEEEASLNIGGSDKLNESNLDTSVSVNDSGIRFIGDTNVVSRRGIDRVGKSVHHFVAVCGVAGGERGSG